MRLQFLLVVCACTLGLASNASASLIADYQLNGDAVDDISSNTAASTDTTATADRFGSGSAALDFNGTTSIVRPVNVGLDDYTQDFSVSLWFRPDAIGSYQGLFSDSTPSASNNFRWHTLGRLETDGRLLFGAGTAQQAGGEIWLSTTGTVNAAQWNHAAFLYDVAGGTGTISIYLNGVLDGSSSKTFAPAPLATTETWTLGAQNDDGSDVNFFGGAMDGFQIYDHVLSVGEIQALAVPEPASLTLAGMGLLALAAGGRRRRTP
jgi:hypothetical protein